MASRKKPAKRAAKKSTKKKPAAKRGPRKSARTVQAVESARVDNDGQRTR